MTTPATLLETLSTHADRADAETAWPAASWEALRHAGGLRWAIPTEYGGDGLQGGAPLELMALRGSITAEVRCRQVRLGRDWLLAGPAERVLQTGRGGAGGLETSCLALGLCRAAFDYLRHEAESRPPLQPVAQRLG